MTEEDLEQMQMERVSNMHRIQGMLGGMGKDDLDVLKMLFSSMCGEDGQIVAAQYVGMVKQILIIKHDVCACGGDHETAEDLLKEDAASNLQQVMANEVPDGPSGATLMYVYRLEIRPSDGAIVCRDCGLWYTSLKDRMLKEPDDCHGCHMKSAQG